LQVCSGLEDARAGRANQPRYENLQARIHDLIGQSGSSDTNGLYYSALSREAAISGLVRPAETAAQRSSEVPRIHPPPYNSILES
jgi:hypothetical protein